LTSSGAKGSESNNNTEGSGVAGEEGGQTCTPWLPSVSKEGGGIFKLTEIKLEGHVKLNSILIILLPLPPSISPRMPRINF